MSAVTPPRKPLIIRFADGHRYEVLDESVSDTLLNVVFLRFYALALLGWAMVGQPLPLTNSVNSAQLSVLWGVLSLVGLFWLFIALSIVRIAHRYGALQSVYTPLITLPSIALGPLLSATLLGQIDIALTVSDADWLASMVKAAVVILVLDIFFGSYVAPFHSGLRDIERPAAPIARAAPAARVAPIFPDPHSDVILLDDDPIDIQSPRPIANDRKPIGRPDSEKSDEIDDAILVGSERFSVDDLMLLRSDDHYVNVVTKTRRVLVRGRLSDALQQIPVSAGIQINRSAWIAFAAISTVEGDDPRQQLIVKLVTGEEERVAQSRRHALLAAMSLQREVES